MNLSYRSSSSDKLKAALTNNRFGNTSDKLINVAKREKLKELLVDKFMKKYGVKNRLPVIEEEISNFLQNEKLNDADLKCLDDKLSKLISEIKSQESLKKGLLSSEAGNHLSSNFKENFNERKNQNNSNSNNNNNSYNIYNNANNKNQNLKSDFILPDLSDALSVKSKASKMSGASHLSKFNENNAKAKADEKEELDFLKAKSPKQERLNFEEEGDEWNAIVKFNHQLHLDEKAQNKLKDMEIKKRIKEDLDNQIRQKLKRKHEENLKDKEFDQILLNHCDYLSQLEIQRERERKEKIMKEKENRDLQLKDERKKKRMEIIKEKKFDRETVKNIKAELQKEQEMKMRKKQQEVELLHKTLRENELNRMRTMENLHKEKLDDVKAIDEYNKVLERQEQERAEYFRKIERNGNNYVNKMAQTVLVDLDKKTKEEDDKMRQYLEEKEKRCKEEDEKRKHGEREMKRHIKDYLDMQVHDKKRMQNFEKNLDHEQARIWKIDCENFHSQEKDINQKVRALNYINSQYLKSQVESKKSKEHNKKMNDEEYALNQDILEKIKTVNSNFKRNTTTFT